MHQKHSYNRKLERDFQMSHTQSRQHWCLNSLIEEAKLVEKKYQILMLWKKGNQKLLNNYEAALRRLIPLQRRLQRNHELFNR